jgi:hypothetical protein
MIEPQIHNGQRGVIGQQHGLQKLTETLAVLSQGQAAQQQRDTQIQAQLATVAQHVAALTTSGQRLVRAVGVLAVLTLGLGVLVGWQMAHPPELGYVRAVGALDATLGQQWGTLPKATQEAFTSTYRALGLSNPGERQRK